MRVLSCCRVVLAASCLALTGCGRGDAPELAEAGGIVTFKGQPVPSATVVYVPEAGPAAYGTTGADGRFVWMTRAEAGAMVGSGKVTITAVEPYELKTEEQLTAADLKNIGRSLIPKKYGSIENSGLTATVKSGEKNEFEFALTE